jgi:hypothetical protein
MTTKRPMLVLPPALAPLAKESRWVVWKWVKGKTGKWTKPPYQGCAPGRYAKSDDPSTWCDVNTAMLCYTEGHCDGLGFVLGDDAPLGALDLDDCRNKETSELHPWARAKIALAQSYVEVTPSGEGVRIIGLASGKPIQRKFIVPNGNGVSCEPYRRTVRYITITGQQIGDGGELSNIDGLIDDVLAELDETKQAKAKAGNGAGDQVARQEHDLESLIKDGCGNDFGGDRSRAIWYMIHQLIKQGRSDDEIVTVLLDRGNGISAHVYDQGRPEEYARKQVEKARQSGTDTDAEIERLAKLSALQYEHERKAAAERLKVRASTLDRLVQAERDKLGLVEDDAKQGRAVSFPELEPWSEPVDGAALLNALAYVISRHIVMRKQGRHTTALWAVHTFLLDAFMISPRLAVRSPIMQCGKSTLLDILSYLVCRALPTANVTPAVLFRVIESHRPCLLVDEGDTFLPENDELRGIINSGHRRGGQVLRSVGDDFEPRAFATYSALAIAAIGNLPGTIADRSVVIDLKRRLRRERIVSFSLNNTSHLTVLARMAARWAADNAVAVAAAAANPEMPGAIINRRRDNWAPLFAIAKVAGGRWPQRVEAAALKAGAAGDDDEASLVEVLLSDIKALFSERTIDRISSSALVDDLVALEGRPWAELGKSQKKLTQVRLARMLKPLKIVPETIRVGDKTAKGYYLDQFKDAFARYLAAEGAFETSQRNNADETGTSELFQGVTTEPDVTDRKCEKSANDGPCYGVTDEKGESGQNEHTEGGNGLAPVGTDNVTDVADVTLPAGNGGAERYPLVCEHCGAPERPGNPVQQCAVDGLTHLLHRHCQAEWLGEGTPEPAPPSKEASPPASDPWAGLDIPDWLRRAPT